MKRRYAAVFLVMLSNLMFELLLTRIFSATMWYHFAFVAVSIALFGTTVGAVAVQLAPRHFAEDRSYQQASRYALLYGIAVVLCTIGLLYLRPTFGSSWQELGSLVLLYLLIALPFVLCGVFICLALVRAGDRVGSVYCADLLGAGTGCALFVAFMDHGEGPRGVLLLGAVAALGAALMAASAADRRTVAAAGLVAAACVAAFGLKLDGDALRVRWAKGRPETRPVYERWNAFSRIVVDRYSRDPFGWGLGKNAPKTLQHAQQAVLIIDSAAATVMTRFDGDLAKLEHLKWDVTALAHSIRRRGRTLVIGVGGARDVLTALAFGHQVVGVEVNEAIVDLLRGPFAAFTGRLDSRLDVRLVHDEARSFIARSPERYDVIQASLVDTWAAAANGAYVLSENALYTREAFGEFLDHLTPDGILTLSRWYWHSQPGETLRLTSLAASVLRERGVEEPLRHLFLARNENLLSSVATLLVGARAFDDDELAALRRWCAEKGFLEILSPGVADGGVLAELVAPRTPERLLAEYPIDLSAPTDDRPFFFNMLRLRDAFRIDRSQHADLIAANADAVVSLAWLFVIVLVLSLVFILAPLWLRRAEGGTATRAGWRFLYFASIGLGFILVELSLMQRLMIALGHPIYGLTVVLFSLLVAAGFGSLWTQRAIARGRGRAFLGRALVAALAIGVVTGLASGAFGPGMAAAPAWARLSGAVLMLVPLGFVLGVPMAAGLALSATDPAGHRALYWGTNGAASVCGSVAATMFSLALGVSGAYAIGLGAYLSAALAAVFAFRAASTSPASTPPI
jgi:SAM-dependent methyltransferase